jgi:hypothetical protein
VPWFGRVPEAEAFGRCRNQGRGGEDIPQGLKPPYLSRYRRPRLKPLAYLEATAKDYGNCVGTRCETQKPKGTRARSGTSLGYGDLSAGVELLQNAL